MDKATKGTGKMTPKQEKVFNFIASYINKSGRSPSNEEIMRALGIKNKATVCHYLDNLELEGKITRHKMKHNSIKLGASVPNNKTKKLIQEVSEDLDALSTFLCIPDEDTEEQVLTAYRITNTIIEKLTNYKL